MALIGVDRYGLLPRNDVLHAWPPVDYAALDAAPKLQERRALVAFAENL